MVNDSLSAMTAKKFRHQLFSVIPNPKLIHMHNKLKCMLFLKLNDNLTTCVLSMLLLAEIWLVCLKMESVTTAPITNRNILQFISYAKF